MLFLDKAIVLTFEFPIMISHVEVPMAAVTETNKVCLIGARF